MSPDAFCEAMMAAIVRTVTAYYGKGGAGYGRASVGRIGLKRESISATIARREGLNPRGIGQALRISTRRVTADAERMERATLSDAALATDLRAIHSQLWEAVHAAAGAAIVGATVRSAA